MYVFMFGIQYKQDLVCKYANMSVWIMQVELVHRSIYSCMQIWIVQVGLVHRSMYAIMLMCASMHVHAKS